MGIPSEPLQEAAQAAKTPRTPFRSSYSRIMRSLSKAYHQITDAMPKDVHFKLVLIEARAAALCRRLDHIDIQSLTNANADISASLMKMQNIKQTVAFHSQYMNQYAPLKVDSSQRQLQHDELNRKVVDNIKTLHENIADINRAFEQKESKAEVRGKLDALTKTWDAILSDTEKLISNVYTLQTKLDNLHRDIYLLLPAHERAGLHGPKGAPAQPPMAPLMDEGVKPE